MEKRITEKKTKRKKKSPIGLLVAAFEFILNKEDISFLKDSNILFPNNFKTIVNANNNLIFTIYCKELIGGGGNYLFI